MARRRGQRKGYLRAEGGSWLLTYRVYTRECPAGQRITKTIGPAEGTGKLTKKQAERFAYDHYLKPLDTSVLRPLSTLTTAQFWEQRFWPHLQKNRKYATQIQYASLWKTWLEPACGSIRLFEVRPDDIDQAISAALTARRSSSTARHIRKVAGALFSHARRMQCFQGENPALVVEAPRVVPTRRIRALSPEDCAQLLEHLRNPVRTMVQLAITLSLGASELLGLEERHINFSDRLQLIEGDDTLEPHWLAVREHLYHGRRGTLKTGKRRRDLPMPPELEAALAAVVATNKSRGPEAPLFQTRNGTPHSADHVRKRVLIRVVSQLRDSGVATFPEVNWNVLRHTHATLSKNVGMSDFDRMRLMGHASPNMTDRYTHEDRQRLKSGVERIIAAIHGNAGGRGKIVNIAGGQ